MSKKVVFTLLIVLLVFTLMPKPAQGIDFTTKTARTLSFLKER